LLAFAIIECLIAVAVVATVVLTWPANFIMPIALHTGPVLLCGLVVTLVMLVRRHPVGRILIVLGGLLLALALGLMIAPNSGCRPLFGGVASNSETCFDVQQSRVVQTGLAATLGLVLCGAGLVHYMVRRTR
jgi:hypothetical protein